jgi:oxygen-independent coproporphyrinogen-3 oxidase
MTDPNLSPLIEPPDSVGLAEAAGEWKSAYVHIPFCDRVCPYCDFAVVEGRDDTIGRYLTALSSEIDLEPQWHELDAVFIGGGTPSKLQPGSVAAIVGRLRDRFGFRPGVEISLEANPEDVTPRWASEIVEAGVDRVSLGIQSLDEDILQSLGRRHSPGQARASVAALRRAGIRSVNVDLIFGTPGESIESWSGTVAGALEMEVDHVSTYALTVEPPTALGRAVRAGAPAPDPDDQADKWEMAARMAAGAGFVRYEVSNHARAGHGCRYNLSVWGMGEYLAFGLGAHGFRDGVRTRNVRRLDTYLERVEAGIGAVQGADVVDGWSAELERLMLGARRVAGVRLGPGGERLLANPAGGRLVEAGVIAVRDDRLMVKRPLLTDAVTRTILALDES